MKKTIILLLLALLCTTALTAINTDDQPDECKENPSGYHDYVILSQDAATFTEYGKVIRECKFCRDRQEIIQEEEKPLGHDWEHIESITCTASGRICDRCRRCGKEENIQEYGTGLGHDYVSKHRDGTCTSASVDWDECTRCGDKTNITEGTTAPHTWVEDYTEDAT